MQISIDKEILYKAIIIADSIISSKNINTILANCLFKIADNILEIISTDNEIAVRTKLSCIANESASFTVNGKKLAGILKELPNDELVITIDKSFQMDLKTRSQSVKGHYRLVGTSAQDYPDVPKFNKDNAVQLEQSMLKEMIKKVIYSASSDTIKPIFNGVYFISESKGKISSVATDSRRLSIVTRQVEGGIELKSGVIIPLKTVSEIFRILSSTDNCEFNISSNQCFIRIGETEIISRIVDGQFPNYKQVIPKEHLFSAQIETKKFIESIRRVMVFTREPVNKIILNFNPDKLVIEASTPELGEAEEEIEIKSSSKEKFSVGVNAQFMIDALKEMDSETVKCGITGQMSPMTINPADDENFTAVIMPIQIRTAHSE